MISGEWDKMTEQEKAIHTWTESVDAEIYEELLNRYERILVFAGQLQEKMSQQKLLAEKNANLEAESRRLEHRVAVDEAYIRLLENALQALGVMKPESLSGPDSP
jgi:hypothetical protein